MKKNPHSLKITYFVLLLLYCHQFFNGHHHLFFFLTEPFIQANVKIQIEFDKQEKCTGQRCTSLVSLFSIALMLAPRAELYCIAPDIP